MNFTAASTHAFPSLEDRPLAVRRFQQWLDAPPSAAAKAIEVDGAGTRR